MRNSSCGVARPTRSPFNSNVSVGVATGYVNLRANHNDDPVTPAVGSKLVQDDTPARWLVELILRVSSHQSPRPRGNSSMDDANATRPIETQAQPPAVTVRQWQL